MTTGFARGRVFHDGTLSKPRLDHPEGVAVHTDGSVWCGGEAGQIYRLDADGIRLEQVADTGGFVLGVAFGPRDVLYACDLAHRCVFRVDTATGDLERFTDGGSPRPFVAPNCPAVGPDGTVYVSDSNVQGEPGPGIYRFEANGAGGLWYDGPLDFANGLAVSPDGSAVYVVESFRPGVTRIPVDHGVPGEPSHVVSLSGVVPDGIAFGPDGWLYIGCYEPSQVLRADLGSARVETVLADPTAHLLCHPTNLAFRGTELFTSNLGRWHITMIEALGEAEARS